MNENKQREALATNSSPRRLELLSEQLTARDLAILRDIEARRYVTSGQIRRLWFGGAGKPGTVQRNTNRALGRLQGHGLLTPLKRSIGGARGGSRENIWALAPAGFKLLHKGEDMPRKHKFEPSQRFAEHTLAISELDVRLRKIAGVAVTQSEFEPTSWRSYNGRTLKPDYFAVTNVGEYEDFWFFELDLATEMPSQVQSKLQEYQDYFRSGEEQRKTGIFPRVVWVAPDKKRQDDLRRYIREGKSIQLKDLFVVITLDELEHLIREGVTP